MRNIIFLLCILLPLNLFGNTSISFGRNNDQISIDRGEGEIWKPLFFDVDAKSQIHIPDFYKGRIAVFNTDSKLVNSITVSEGISPRMNFFSLNENGTYTTYDNYSLYLLSEKGEVIWKQQMGIGVIPTRIFVDGRGVFIKFPSTDFYRFSYEAGKPYETVKDILINETMKIEDSMLIYQTDVKTIWQKGSKFKKIIIKQDSQEDLKIPVPYNSTSGSGYWVVYGLDSHIYTVLFTDENLEVLKIY